MMAWFAKNFIRFCLIVLRLSAAKHTFTKKYGYHRRLNNDDDPCSSGSNDSGGDCSDAAAGNQLFYEKYKEVMIDNNNKEDDSILLDCSISSPENPSAETRLNTLEYWYAVETTEDEVRSWSDSLEDKIYDIAFDQMSFCIMTGKRRRERHLSSSNSKRDLGILSVTSMPYDMHRSDVLCPSSLFIDGIFCHVIQGKMRILSRASDDLSLTMVSMLDAIRISMAPNTILLGSDIPTVTNVTYLGISEADVENFEIAAVSSNNAILDPNKNGDDDDDNDSLMLLIFLLILLLALIMLLLLLINRRRENSTVSPESTYNNDEFGKNYDNDLIINYGNDDNNTIQDNDIYVSPVHANNDKSPYKSPEKFRYGDDVVSALVSPNANDLAGYHSGLDVHRCQSSTCKICLGGFKNVGLVNFQRFNPDEIQQDKLPEFCPPVTDNKKGRGRSRSPRKKRRNGSRSRSRSESRSRSRSRERNFIPFK